MIRRHALVLKLRGRNLRSLQQVSELHDSRDNRDIAFKAIIPALKLPETTSSFGRNPDLRCPLDSWMIFQ